ncbi:MAG TPA: hypothetical protein VNI52_07295 [Sphingobacteriaceae bacterium]|nr:hypothetical protein [Sphingobacteriaceae bacterium]
MGEYFPFILAAAALIYRVYNNFVKEQEKARKRNPAERPDYQAESEENPMDFQSPAKPVYVPQTELIEETYNPEKPYEPIYKHIRHEAPVREKYEQVKYERIKPETIAVRKYKEEVPNEVALSRVIHAPHKHGSTDENEQANERSAYADFDIHDAVIKSAILNRPEY